jgi:ABC-2 type transport system permease protein
MRFFYDFLVLFVAEIKKFLRWKERLLWDLIGTLTMFIAFVFVWSAVFGAGLQGIGSLTRENMIVFLLAGTLLWEVIGLNLGPVSHVFINEKYMKTSTYFFISPASRFAYLLAKAGISLMQMLITNGIVILIAMTFFNFTFKGSFLLAILVFILTFLCFHGFGIAIAALGAWREGIADFSWIFSNVLMIFSGVWYPIQIFPEPIKSFCEFLPTTQAIEMLRSIGINGANFFQILPNLAYLSAFTIAFLALGYFVFKWVEGRAMLIGI